VTKKALTLVSAFLFTATFTTTALLLYYVVGNKTETFSCGVISGSQIFIQTYFFILLCMPLQDEYVYIRFPRVSY